MSKDVTKKASSEVAVAQDFNEELCGFGDESGISFDDVTIGRIAIQQALSKTVQTGVAKIGDIVNLLDNSKIGDSKTPCEFIPIKATFYWIEKKGDKFVKRVLGRMPADLPREEIVGNDIIKRMEHHSFYVLLPHEIEQGMAMPLEIAFRSTGRKAAGILSAMITKLWMQKKNTWASSFKLGVSQETKDNHIWYGPTISVGRATTPEEHKMCTEWAMILKSSWGEMKHQEDIEPAVETPSEAPSNQESKAYDMGKF